jgi:hypothetical protein
VARFLGVLEAQPQRHGRPRLDCECLLNRQLLLYTTNFAQTPVYTLLETPLVPDMDSKLFLTDDPALVVLYAQLREKTLQTLRGASKITPRVEWEFVLHSAKLYDRMGCDLLGLDLGKFLHAYLPSPGHYYGILIRQQCATGSSRRRAWVWYRDSVGR